tara:strand:- start:5512 stop:5805 length:294 start_codon:yes stop_codon:yes gene_type:complete
MFYVYLGFLVGFIILTTNTVLEMITSFNNTADPKLKTFTTWMVLVLIFNIAIIIFIHILFYDKLDEIMNGPQGKVGERGPKGDSGDTQKIYSCRYNN